MIENRSSAPEPTQLGLSQVTNHSSGAASAAGNAPDAAASAGTEPRGAATINTELETLWAQVGGTEVFEKITRSFYVGVKEDPLLSPMYPQDDWEGAIWRLRSFLEQYWGGPTTYSEQRGHPRLRMRHQPYRINPEARDRWLFHMNRALDEAELPPLHDAALRDYVDRAAHSLVNTFEQ